MWFFGRKKTETVVTWQEHLIALNHAPLAWFEAGQGDTVVFINGGPGDDHGYLRPVVEPLAKSFHCVLYDQRGTGRSELSVWNQETLNITGLLDDLEALRKHLRQDKLTLVGHSWGALLALQYAKRYPQRVHKLALIAPGVLNDAMAEVASANVLKPLSAAERETFQSLRDKRQQALEEGNLSAFKEIHIEQITRYYSKSWFYSPDAAERFNTHFTHNYNYNPQMAQLVLQSIKNIDFTDDLETITAPTFVFYGYQDYLPITQAYLLKDAIPDVTLEFANQCGHEPWYEQPDVFYKALRQFLRS